MMVENFGNPADMARYAAAVFVNVATEAIESRGRFNVFLSGGSTPKLMHSMLVANDKDSIDWNKVWFFCGDERYLPEGNPDRNETMFRATLIDPLDAKHFFPMTFRESAEDSAIRYEEVLSKNLVGPVDLMFLGMGGDGHTLSLFPGSPALKSSSLVAAGPGLDPPAAWRTTMTLAFLPRVEQAYFLLAGADKKEKFEAVMAGEDYPSGRAAKVLKNVTWLTAF